MSSEADIPSSGDFFRLTPSEFERLVAEVFAKAGVLDVRVVGGSADQGVDVLAKKGAETIAVQVKHKKKVSLSQIQRFVDSYYSNASAPRHLIFVTSSEIPETIRNGVTGIPKDAQLQIVDGRDLHLMLMDHSSARPLQVWEASLQRQKMERKRLYLSIIAGIMSILAGVLSVYSFQFTHKAPLDRRIDTVEKALSSISDLEKYLSDIKQDMQATQKATEIINEKHAQAKELEKLTTVQLAALQSTLQIRNWKWTVLDYLLGFVFGVASSLAASVLYAKWRQRKAIE